MQNAPAEAVERRHFEAVPTVVISVPGRPVPWARARTRGGIHFTPRRQRDWMALFRDRAEQQMAGRPPLDRPVRIEALFTLPIPASWSRRKRQAAADGLVRPAGKPDLDNMLKLVTDCLRGVVYRDDALICEARTAKRYGEAPATTVRVEPL